MYLAKFDENGYRTETYIATEYTEEQKSQMYADGFVDLSEDDWNYYVGNHGMGDNGTGYIRDAVTGKPVSAPPPAPLSKDVLIAQLDTQYLSDKQELLNYYLEFSANNDTEGMNEIQKELIALLEKYDNDIEAIKTEEV